MKRPCIGCGTPTDDSRCADCQLPDTRTKPTSTARGYGTHWRKLSERARRLQPFCSDCGTTEDLTADHSPEAWRRQAAGLPVRLLDIDIVCRGCNTKRGRARPGGDNPLDGVPDLAAKAQSQSRNENHVQ